jgi:predicted RNA binding protein YcfA (HicA-like mRNA interferase family)
MSKLGPTSRMELIRSLRLLGFRGPFAGGKHQFMIKEQARVRIPNPHRSDIGKNLLRAILREACISIDEWENV